METAAERRHAETTRFFAMQRFAGRKVYRTLNPSLRRDVKAFFGSLRMAEAAGEALLFSAGDAAGLTEDAHGHATAGLGRLVGDKFMVHIRDLDALSPRLRTYVAIAEAVAGTIENAVLLRIHLGSRRLSALDYPKFEAEALPRLSTRTRIDLRSGEVDIIDHSQPGRMAVLAYKSAYMAPEDECYDEQKSFDEKVVAALDGLEPDRLPFAELAKKLLAAGLRLPY